MLAVLGALLLAAGGLLAYGVIAARSDPRVRVTQVAMPGLEAPLRIVLASDSHVAGRTNPPARLARIVAQINARKPDVVLLAGDFIGDDVLYGEPVTAEAAIAPLGGLRPRLGAFAVIGNHDAKDIATLHAVARALGRHGVTLLENEVVRVGGTSIAGVSPYGRRVHPERNVRATFDALLAAPAPRILVAHSPAIMRAVTRPIDLVLAGHTHCGQIALPFYGAIETAAQVDRSLSCGEHALAGFRLIVGGGLGTSRLPLRLFAPPEFWVIDLRPA